MYITTNYVPLNQYRNFIFDLDNTLVNCHIYYINRKKEFGIRTAQRLGLSPEMCQSVLEELDLLAVRNIHDAFSRRRFPASFKAASLACDVIAGHEPDLYAAEEMFALGNGVFYEKYPMYDNVTEVLSHLDMSGKRLFLCTKGEYSIQMNKIIKNSLFDFFPHNQIYVVPKKTKEEMWKIAVDHKLIPAETVMIGDSLKDDIKSAQEVGFVTVHITGNEAANHWKYEDTSGINPNYRLETVADLLPNN